MLRLATPGHLRFAQAGSFEATFGGGEANVAVSLANYGIDTEFVTRLPENDIADCCLRELRSLETFHERRAEDIPGEDFAHITSRLIGIADFSH